MKRINTIATLALIATAGLLTACSGASSPGSVAAPTTSAPAPVRRHAIANVDTVDVRHRVQSGGVTSGLEDQVRRSYVPVGYRGCEHSTLPQRLRPRVHHREEHSVAAGRGRERATLPALRRRPVAVGGRRHRHLMRRRGQDAGACRRVQRSWDLRVEHAGHGRALPRTASARSVVAGRDGVATSRGWLIRFGRGTATACGARVSLPGRLAISPVVPSPNYNNATL